MKISALGATYFTGHNMYDYTGENIGFTLTRKQ